MRFQLLRQWTTRHTIHRLGLPPTQIRTHGLTTHSISANYTLQNLSNTRILEKMKYFRNASVIIMSMKTKDRIHEQRNKNPGTQDLRPPSHSPPLFGNGQVLLEGILRRWLSIGIGGMPLLNDAAAHTVTVPTRAPFPVNRNNFRDCYKRC